MDVDNFCIRLYFHSGDFQDELLSVSKLGSFYLVFVSDKLDDIVFIHVMPVIELLIVVEVPGAECNNNWRVGTQLDYFPHTYLGVDARQYQNKHIVHAQVADELLVYFK